MNESKICLHRMYPGGYFDVLNARTFSNVSLLFMMLLRRSCFEFHLECNNIDYP